MPELPEMEAWRRQLNDPVSAFPIEKAGPAHVATLKTFDPPLATLDGRRFAGAERRAKRLMFPTDDGEPANLPAPYATISSVNTFRLLFDHYFGTGMGLLPDRTFAPYVAEKPFDVFEISDRLAASP